MKLKIPPQTPVYWSDTDTLKIGFDDPLALKNIGDRELKLIDLLRKGTNKVEAISHAKVWGIAEKLTETLIQKAQIRPVKVPSVSVMGSGPLAIAMAEANYRVFSRPKGKPDFAVLVGNWAIPPNAWHKVASLGIKHLPIIHLENEVLVGPIMRPNESACIRCHFLERADKHPDLMLLAMQRAFSTLPQEIKLTPLHRMASQLATALIIQDAPHGWKVSSDLEFEKFSLDFHPGCGCR